MKAPSNALIAGVCAAWGVGMLLAFWQVEGRYLRPASRPAGAADLAPERLPLSPVAALETERGTLSLRHPGSVLLLNFWNPACPCSRFNEAHVARIAQEFGGRGVRIVTVVECGLSAQETADALAAWRSREENVFAVTADPGGRIARAFGVWAAPAAVILNAAGQVAFVGGYNAARFCEDRRTAWAERALDSLLAGQKPLHAKTLFYGCQVLSQPAAP